MVRVASVLSPALWPALLFSGVLLLQGCSLLPKKEAADTGASTAGVVRSGDTNGDTAKDDDKAKADGRRNAFTVDVRGPETERDYLARHLEIQRYRELDDLGVTEVSRLMVAAEANARELLGTLGYFTPTLTLELNETPDSTEAPREVVITVAPGERTKVSTVQIRYAGQIANDPSAEAQRDAIRTGWALRAGEPFTQGAWDDAKTTALRSLTAKRFPTGSVEISRAEIDADRHEARLGVTYQSGPAYKFGPLVLRGVGRYDADAARRIARLPTGTDYDQQKLLDAQQRLASSGYYDSVFLTLDTDHNTPLAAASRPGKAWRSGDCNRRSARPRISARSMPCWPCWASSRRSPPSCSWNIAACITPGQPRRATHRRSPKRMLSSASASACCASLRTASKAASSASTGPGTAGVVKPCSRRVLTSVRISSCVSGPIT